MPKKKGPDEVMTLNQARQYLKIRFETCKTLLESQQIPGKYIAGSGWRVLKADLDSWIRSGQLLHQ